MVQVVLVTEEYHGVAGGSFAITLAKPALSFAYNLLTEMCLGILSMHLYLAMCVNAILV